MKASFIFGFTLVVSLLIFSHFAYGSTNNQCYPLHSKLRLGQVVNLKEPCAPTVVVQVRINRKPPYDSQGGGNNVPLLIDYGSGAVIRIHQIHGQIYITAVTTNPRTQNLSIWFQPQTSVS